MKKYNDNKRVNLMQMHKIFYAHKHKMPYSFSLMFIVMFMIILLSGGVSAIINDDIYYSAPFIYHPSVNVTHDNSSYLRTGTVQGATYTTGAACKITSDIGCVSFDHTATEWVKFDGSDPTLNFIVNPTLTQNFTWSAWIFNGAENVGGDAAFFDTSLNSNEAGLRVVQDFNENQIFIDFRSANSGGRLRLGWYPFSGETWHHVVVLYNTTDQCLYEIIDYTTVYTDCVTDAYATDNNTIFTIGFGALDTVDALIQEIIIMNRTITGEEIEYLYNSGSGQYITTAPTSSAPNIELLSPLQNNTRQSIVPFDITINVTSDTVPSNTYLCELMNSTNLIDSGSTDYVSGLTLTYPVDYEVQYQTNLDIICYDNSPTNLSTLLNVKYNVDTVTPIISINTPVNGTYYNTDFNIDSTCYDDYVWIYELKFVQDGVANITTYRNDTNISVAESGILSLENEINVSIYPDAQYLLNYTCSDSHTKNKIGFYTTNINQQNKYIEYVTDTDVNVKIKLLNGNINNIQSIRLTDRYNFNFNAQDITNRKKYKFEVTSSEPLILINEHTAHFVTGVHWLDFYNDDTQATYQVQKVTDNIYYVEIQTNDLNFKSIGGLNINNVQQIIYIDDANPVISNQQISLNETVEQSTEYIYNFDCTDIINIKNLTIQDNSTGGVFSDTEYIDLNSLFTVPVNNITYYYNSTTDVGHVGVRSICYDQAGNSIISTPVTYTSTAIEIPVPGIGVSGIVWMGIIVVMFIIILGSFISVQIYDIYTNNNNNNNKIKNNQLVIKIIMALIGIIILIVIGIEFIQQIISYMT